MGRFALLFCVLTSNILFCPPIGVSAALASKNGSSFCPKNSKKRSSSCPISESSYSSTKTPSESSYIVSPDVVPELSPKVSPRPLLWSSDTDEYNAVSPQFEMDDWSNFHIHENDLLAEGAIFNDNSYGYIGYRLNSFAFKNLLDRAKKNRKSDANLVFVDLGFCSANFYKHLEKELESALSINAFRIYKKNEKIWVFDPQGVLPSCIVERKHIVVCPSLVVDKDGNLVIPLVLTAGENLKKKIYSFVGGGVDNFTDRPSVFAKKELSEELGFSIDKINDPFFAFPNVCGAFLKNICFHFIKIEDLGVKDFYGLPKDKKEIIDVKYLTLKDFWLVLTSSADQAKILGEGCTFMPENRIYGALLWILIFGVVLKHSQFEWILKNCLSSHQNIFDPVFDLLNGDDAVFLNPDDTSPNFITNLKPDAKDSFFNNLKNCFHCYEKSFDETFRGLSQQDILESIRKKIFPTNAFDLFNI